MPVAMSGSVAIHYEDTGGDGPAILFLHEFAGDHRSGIAGIFLGDGDL